MTVPSPLYPRDICVFYNSCWESYFIMQLCDQSVFRESTRIWVPGHAQAWEMKGSWLPASLEKRLSITMLCWKVGLFAFISFGNGPFLLWTKYCWAPSYYSFAFPSQCLRGEIELLEEWELFKAAFMGWRKDDQVGCHSRKYKLSPKSHPRTLPLRLRYAC